jgi:hypothetical protein
MCGRKDKNRKQTKIRFYLKWQDKIVILHKCPNGKLLGCILPVFYSL